MKIVILTGSAGVGKDTYAESIKQNLEPVYVTAFADTLKDTARMLGWDGDKDKAGRTLLQDLGQVINEYNSSKGEEFLWTSSVVDKIALALIAGAENFIITDARYDHEVVGIKKAFPHANVKVIRLIRDFTSKLTDTQKQHPSEQPISAELVDKVINVGEKTYEIEYFSAITGKMTSTTLTFDNLGEMLDKMLPKEAVFIGQSSINEWTLVDLGANCYFRYKEV